MKSNTNVSSASNLLIPSQHFGRTKSASSILDGNCKHLGKRASTEKLKSYWRQDEFAAAEMNSTLLQLPKKGTSFDTNSDTKSMTSPKHTSSQTRPTRSSCSPMGSMSPRPRTPSPQVLKHLVIAMQQNLTKKEQELSKTKEELRKVAAMLELSMDELNEPKEAKYKLLNAPYNLKYKTTLCNHFMQRGSCPLAEDCQFAHGLTELRILDKHPSFKTKFCRLQLKGSACPYGDKCYYYHSLDEKRGNLMPSNHDVSACQSTDLNFCRSTIVPLISVTDFDATENMLDVKPEVDVVCCDQSLISTRVAGLDREVALVEWLQNLKDSRDQ